MHQDSGPQIQIRQVAAGRESVTARWNVAWLVGNLGISSLRILSVRIPHGQFRSEEHRFDPSMDLNAGKQTEFQTLVRCNEPAGVVTENAFLIFYVSWSGDPWRIFVRLRVVINSEGQLETTVESITNQKVGFSGVLS